MNNKLYSKNYFVILASCYKGCTYGLLKTGKFRGNPEFWVIETWSVKFSSLAAGNLRKKSCPKYFRNFGNIVGTYSSPKICDQLFTKASSVRLVQVSIQTQTRDALIRTRGCWARSPNSTSALPLKHSDKNLPFSENNSFRGMMQTLKILSLTQSQAVSLTCKKFIENGTAFNSRWGDQSPLRSP